MSAECEPLLPERNWTFGYQLNEVSEGPKQAAEQPVGSVISEEPHQRRVSHLRENV
jgi:hypothetical protein